MDDKPKGVSHERTSGRADESRTSPAGKATARARTSAGASEPTRNWADEGARGSAGVADREHGTEQRTERIRAEIERTRDDMSDTADAIQERLRPGNVATNVAASVGDTASEAADNVRSAANETLEDVADSRIVLQMRANPIPAAMVGIGLVGLGWLAFGNRKAPSQGRRGQSATRAYGTTTTRSSERGEDYGAGEPGIVDRANELASRTGKYARNVGSKARNTTQRAQNQLQRAINENPLYVGAAALAAGAMIGIALPETERENELMGETRDSVVEGAQEMARGAATRVHEAATDAAKRVQEVATDAVGLLSKDQ
jgi:hypothetical protein